MTVDATTSLMNEGITDDQLFIFILKDDFFYQRGETGFLSFIRVIKKHGIFRSWENTVWLEDKVKWWDWVQAWLKYILNSIQIFLMPIDHLRIFSFQKYLWTFKQWYFILIVSFFRCVWHPKGQIKAKVRSFELHVLGDKVIPYLKFHMKKNIRVFTINMASEWNGTSKNPCNKYFLNWLLIHLLKI